MHPNEELLTRFYTALGDSDEAAVAACYATDATYYDPVFRELRGARALAMWQMFCERGDALQVRFSDIRANATDGTARWEALYDFSRTGRPVHNRISSRFRFRNGLIHHQKDSFSTYRWASMALGPPGRLAGWAPPFQAVLTRQALTALDSFMASRGLTD